MRLWRFRRLGGSPCIPVCRGFKPSPSRGHPDLETSLRGLIQIDQINTSLHNIAFHFHAEYSRGMMQKQMLEYNYRVYVRSLLADVDIMSQRLIFPTFCCLDPEFEKGRPICSNSTEYLGLFARQKSWSSCCDFIDFNCIPLYQFLMELFYHPVQVPFVSSPSTDT